MHARESTWIVANSPRKPRLVVAGFQISLFFQWKPIFQIATVYIFMGEKYVQEFAPNFSMETHFPNSSGPTHLGPVWAHPRGPGLGPPIWAQLGPTHGGPHISGSPERLTTLPQALFFFQKNGPHIFTSPELLGTLPQALFFFQKNGPHIFGSPELLGTLPQALFFQKNDPHIFTSPELVGTLPQALFFPEKWPPYFCKPPTCGYVAAGAFFFRKNGPPYFYKP